MAALALALDFDLLLFLACLALADLPALGALTVDSCTAACADAVVETRARGMAMTAALIRAVRSFFTGNSLGDVGLKLQEEKA